MHKQTPRALINIKRLVFSSIILALIVVSLGAYTRLTHAGLGCPDWPGCYGQLKVPETNQQLAQAQQAFPEQKVVTHKAWNEMIHRYFAGSLGLLILVIALLSFKNRKLGTPLYLPLFILCTVVFQAALGMWTVTMKLMPIVVMGHLLGGFTTLCLLFLLYLRLSNYRLSSSDFSVKKYTKFAILGIVILLGQISLGGWTSSNYAALSCVELPICQAGWQQKLTFSGSFDPISPVKDSYEFGHLSYAQRVTVHVAHRFGAIITTFYLAWLAFMVFTKSQTQFFKNAALLMASVLTLQLTLGVSNIIFSLPLAVAVSHNLVAALLMLTLIRLSYSLKRKI
jgi:cytochrome c oxidase assembly protein subunit 15